MTAPKAFGGDGGFIYGPRSCRLMSFVFNGSGRSNWQDGSETQSEFPKPWGPFWRSGLLSFSFMFRRKGCKIPNRVASLFCGVLSALSIWVGSLVSFVRYTAGCRAGLLEGWSGCKLSGSLIWVAQHEQAAVSSQVHNRTGSAVSENVYV